MLLRDLQYMHNLNTNYDKLNVSYNKKTERQLKCAVINKENVNFTYTVLCLTC